ncbi:MAG: hypothetical protein ACYDCO_06120 [Armatimonadota bacterium]
MSLPPNYISTPPQPRYLVILRGLGWLVLGAIVLLPVIVFLRYFFSTGELSPGSRASRDLLVKGALNDIRAGIREFHKDAGCYPNTLIDMTLEQSAPPTTGLDDNGQQVRIESGSYRGPYLPYNRYHEIRFPANPYKNLRHRDYADISAHWTYDPQTRTVHPKVPVGATTADGIPYSEL